MAVSPGTVRENKLSLTTQLLGFSSCLVMSLGFAMAIVGLKGTWGRARADALGGVVTGVVDFSLWDMTFQSQIQRVVQMSLADSKVVNLDESLCNDGLHQISKVEEVCQTFHMARAFTWVANFVAFGAALSSWAAFGASVVGPKKSKTVITALVLFAALLSLHAFIFAISAMATMAASGGNSQFEIESSLGLGVICMVSLVMSSLVSMVQAVGYHIRFTREMDDLLNNTPNNGDEVARDLETVQV